MGNATESVTVTMDVLFLAHGRREFTEASFKALCATLGDSHRLWVFTDGTPFKELPENARVAPGGVCYNMERYGGPVACLNAYLEYKQEYRGVVDYVAKVDNDLIVCPGWLGACVDVMERYPGVDLLGVEPWTPDEKLFPVWQEPQEPITSEEQPRPTYDRGTTKGERVWIDKPAIFVPRLVSHIGGIGLFRRSAFDRFGLPEKRIRHGQNCECHGTGKVYEGGGTEGPWYSDCPGEPYWGFTEWQWANKGMVKAFMDPPLPVFLLDHLPFEPWRSLSQRYESTCVCGHAADQHPPCRQFNPPLPHCVVCGLNQCRAFAPVQRRQWGTYDPVKHKALWSWWEDKP